MAATAWGGFGVHYDRASAEATLANPLGLSPALGEAVESWQALALPVSHVGAVTGPMAVLTSAGFDSHEPDQLPRIRHFLQGIVQVLAFYTQMPDNLRRDVFTGHDMNEGCTMSLWPGEKAMIQAAYGSGLHRDLMDKSRDGSTFDRSSFTRALLVASQGSWDGDPLAGLM